MINCEGPLKKYHTNCKRLVNAKHYKDHLAICDEERKIQNKYTPSTINREQHYVGRSESSERGNKNIRNLGQNPDKSPTQCAESERGRRIRVNVPAGELRGKLYFHFKTYGEIKYIFLRE